MKLIQWIGIILWILFYGSYFLKLLAGRKRGISVGRMTRGIKPAGTRIIEMFLMVITCLMAGVQVLSIVYYGKWELILVSNSGSKAGIAVLFLGMVIAVTGIIFFILAMKEMKDNWRAGIDESQKTGFVTEGVYGISRNPAFVGFDLFYIGYGILFGNSLQLLFAVLGVFTFHMQIKEEEKHMEKMHGDSYIEYRNKVRRYL